MDVDIQHFEFKDIDRSVFQTILDQELYDTFYGEKTNSFHGAATDYMENEFSIFEHVWFALNNGNYVGIAAIKHTGDPALYVFVKEAHRGHAIGHRLVQEALKTKMEFGSYHTESAKRLFVNYGIPDYITCPP